MLYKVLWDILGILSNMLTILSIWGVNEQSPIFVKVGITIIAIVLGVIFTVTCVNRRIGVKDYYYDESEDKYWVYTNKNRALIDGSSVSIYYKDGNYNEIVALGYVLMSDGNWKVQIKVGRVLDKKLLRKIRISNEECKKYYVKPYVDYLYVGEESTGNNV